MATIERRQRGGRRSPVRWRVRWRDASGRERSKSFDREDHARRYRARLEGDLAAGTWIDPALARVSVAEWAAEWRTTVVDVRPSSLARLEGTVRTHVLPEWGDTALSGVSNADVRAWAARLYGHGYSPSTVRKAVFALRRILDAAVADRRLTHNAAEDVPMPVEEPGEQRYLTAEQVERVANSIEPRFRAMVLVAAYGGLRFGELSALRRSRVDVLRGRVQVAETLVQVGADLSFGPPKTRKGRRTVPLPRRVMDELADHLDEYVPSTTEAVVFTGVFGQPLRREWFRRTWWLPAVAAAGLDRLRFHDLRHTYVSLLIRAGATPRRSPPGPATPPSHSPSTATATSTTTPTTPCPTASTPSCIPPRPPQRRQCSRSPPSLRPPADVPFQGLRQLHRLALRCGVLTDVSVG